MSFLLTVLSGLKIFGADEVIDDFTDRLHYQLSTGLLVAFALLVSFKQFGGKPVECMVPETFSGPWEEYAEHYCFTMNTYYLPIEQTVAQTSIDERNDEQINYYQWVPFILIIEAACFQLPYMVWKVLASHSGIRVHDLVFEAREKKNLDLEIRKSTIQTLTTHLENALKFHRRLQRRKLMKNDCTKIVNISYSSSYVSLMFITSKFLYLFNAAAQFMFMNFILMSGKTKNLYGVGFIIDILNGTSWEHSGVFPRVTLCDYEVRTMGNVQRYTMQCVLVINMLNEKIFIFLWFWYHILIILTGLSIVYWGGMLIIPYFSRKFVTKHMELCEMPFDCEESSKDVERFVSNYLHRDGMFVVRMIENHTNVIFGTDLIMALWKSFYKIEETVSIWAGQTDSMPSCFPQPAPPINLPKHMSHPGGKGPPSAGAPNSAAHEAGVRWRANAHANSQRDREQKPHLKGLNFPDGAVASAPVVTNQKPGNRFFQGLRGRKENRNLILTPEHLMGSKPRMTVIEDSRPQKQPTSEPGSPQGRALPPPPTPAIATWDEDEEEAYQPSAFGSAVSTDERPRRADRRYQSGVDAPDALETAALLPPPGPTNRSPV